MTLSICTRASDCVRTPKPSTARSPSAAVRHAASAIGRRAAATVVFAQHSPVGGTGQVRTPASVEPQGGGRTDSTEPSKPPDTCAVVVPTHDDDRMDSCECSDQLRESDEEVSAMTRSTCCDLVLGVSVRLLTAVCVIASSAKRRPTDSVLPDIPRRHDRRAICPQLCSVFVDPYEVAFSRSCSGQFDRIGGRDKS